MVGSSKRHFVTSLVASVVMLQASVLYAAVEPFDIAQVPLYLGKQVKPNIMIMLDNSGSMVNYLYRDDTSDFDPTQAYYGIFSADKNYEYDPSIPVDTSAYEVTINPNEKGAFKESDCQLGSGVEANCWSGNLLNWMGTRRIDAVRKVLVGGKVENRNGFDYLGNGGTQYKIIGNNEWADDTYNSTDRKFTNYYFENYAPIPNSGVVEAKSPAGVNSGKALSSYYPYPKLVTNHGVLRDVNGEVVAIFGTNKGASADFKVKFPAVIDNPVVVATVISRNDSDPGVVQVYDVNSGYFRAIYKEWGGGAHKESIAYIVAKEGIHELSDGSYFVAGSATSNKLYQSYGENGSCGNHAGNTDSVSFGHSFSQPVVFATVEEDKNGDAIGVRAYSVASTGFTFGLERAEAIDVDPPPSSKKVYYVAFEKGVHSVGGVKLDVGHVLDVKDATKTFYFSSAASFWAPPGLITTLQTINGPNTASVRVKTLKKSSASIYVEEETTCDDEVGHIKETVGYLAFEMAYNLAVVVPSEPTGVLQEVGGGGMRMGITFYRYDSSVNDIYKGNSIDGGTLNFLIPRNPFVKKPSANLSDVDAGGGYRSLSGYIGTGIDEIVDAIEHYPTIWGTTPLAENLWEVIQYFEQDPNGPYYDPVNGLESFTLADATHPELDPYYDPEIGETMDCIKSHVLVFTDGEPYADANVPSFLRDYDEDGNSKDTIGLNVTSGNQNNLDDVAYWAFCNKSQGSCMQDGKAVNPSRDLRSDLDGLQYLQIDTVGFTGNTVAQVLQDTADNAGGTAYAAKDGYMLADSLRQIFDKVVASSAASVAVNAGSLRTDAMLFLARFDSGKWTGSVQAYKLNTDGTIAHELDADGLMIPDSNGWTSSIPQSRVIVSYNSQTKEGIPFQWGQLSDAQKTAIDAENANASSSDLFEYLRGDQSNETQNGGPFRRRVSLLGDIIHSAPVYVGSPAFYYPDDMEDKLYTEFKRTYRDRTPMLYVGANDGMMHAFDAATGVEKFAYVPASVYDHLSTLADQAYDHRYFVDGRITIIDAYFDDDWHTVLVGGLRGGGQGIYALDVTNPDDWASESGGASKVLWEFTDTYDVDLGYTFSRPNIVRLHDGNWAVVFGNGYNNVEVDGHMSATGNAVLYILKLSDGTLLKKIDTGVGFSDSASGNRPNGLSTVAPVDVDGDSIVDYVYGGDLYGNLWKFDLTSTSSAGWEVANNGTPLYIACSSDACSDTNRQPITVRPEVSKHPLGEGYLVFFGTGKYFEEDDNRSSNQQTQTFYAIWDKGEAFSGRAELKERKVLAEVTVNGAEYRVTSGINSSEADGGGTIDWNSQKGWFMDLKYDGVNNGERVVADPLLRGDRVIFTTLLPSEDPCVFGGDSWLMELNATTGAHLDLTPFDVNGDGTFDTTDHLPSDEDGDGDGQEDNVAASGTKSGEGILAQPAIVSADPNVAPDKEYKYMSGSSGNVQRIEERSGGERTGRVSWRQVK